MMKVRLPLLSVGLRLRRHATQGGFTLIEILLVVGIICILVVLGFAGLQGVQRTAQETKCVSNLRQVGVSILSYAADNNGRILPRTLGLYRDTEPLPPKGERTWHSRLIKFGYAEDSDIFFCPSFAPRSRKESRVSLVGNDGGECYGMRMWTAPGTGWGKEREEHKPLTSIREPSDFFLLADTVWTNPQFKCQGYGLVPDSAEQLVHLRHNGMANALFADGHVACKPASYFAELGLPNRQQDYNGNRNRVFATTSQMEF